MSKMQPTRIDWADYTWNPVWGCTFGCPYCYAKVTAKRWGMQIAGRDDFVPTWIDRNFSRAFPKAPSRIFVNSMSDIADWKPEWMDWVLARIKAASKHSFLFLTKRPRTYLDYAFPANVWLGVSATSGQAPGAPHDGILTTFVSIEPLLGTLGPLDSHFAWAIIGAETGRREGKVTPRREWIEEIVADCRRKGIAVFMKSSLEPIMGEDMLREYPEEQK